MTKTSCTYESLWANSSSIPEDAKKFGGLLKLCDGGQRYRPKWQQKVEEQQCNPEITQQCDPNKFWDGTGGPKLYLSLCVTAPHLRRLRFSFSLISSPCVSMCKILFSNKSHFNKQPPPPKNTYLFLVCNWCVLDAGVKIHTRWVRVKRAKHLNAVRFS